MEEWRSVKGYEELYKVSNLGQVRNPSGHVLSTHPNKKGYLRVSLYRNNRQSNPFVHKIVAEAFLREKLTESHQINHKNSVKTDNRSENLEWVTISENIRHARNSGHTCAKLDPMDVESIRTLNDFGFGKIAISEMFGVNRKTIYNVLNDRIWTYSQGVGYR
jgi:2-oxoglutarate dehydrogenase complex dehydrogenase (E1) component-like enzyme